MAVIPSAFILDVGVAIVVKACISDAIARAEVAASFVVAAMYCANATVARTQPFDHSATAPYKAQSIFIILVG